MVCLLNIAKAYPSMPHDYILEASSRTLDGLCFFLVACGWLMLLPGDFLGASR